MSELVHLHNRSGRPKSVIFNGNQIVIDGYGRQHFHADAAAKLLEIYPGTIVTEEEVGTVFDAPSPEALETRRVWLANVTGNPDAPEFVEGVKYYDKVQHIWKESVSPNPRLAKTNISRRYSLGQKSYTAKDGALEGLNLQSVKIELPVYMRREFPKEIAEWMLGRDAKCGQEYRGRLIKSRAPSNFEPDMSWELDEMRTYLKLSDPGAVLGEEEEAFGGDEEEIEQAKRLCWTRLYFRLVDPQTRLPLRKEFNAYAKEQELKKQRAKIERVSMPGEPTKRGPGRPRKHPEGVVA